LSSREADDLKEVLELVKDLKNQGVIGGSVAEGPIRRTREEGSEWELIKILLEGDGDSNKTNTASNTRLLITTQVGQAHAANGMLLDLGTNKQPSEPKLTNGTTETCTACCLCCTGQTDGLPRSDQ
jgi:hypothetical protein